MEKKAAKEAARAEKKREKEGLVENTFFSGQVRHPGPGEGGKEDPSLGRDIHAEDLNVAYGKLVLLENTRLDINYGRKYGLVGRMGAVSPRCCGISHTGSSRTQRRSLCCMWSRR